MAIAPHGLTNATGWTGVYTLRGLNCNDSQNWLRLQGANLEIEFTVYLPRKIVDIGGDLRKGPGPTDDAIAVIQIETARYVNGQCQFQINRGVSPPAPVSKRLISTNQTGPK